MPSHRVSSAFRQFYSADPSIAGFKYSGRMHPAHPANSFQKRFVDIANKLFQQQGVNTSGKGPQTSATPYAVVLQNWYEPQHTIGLHADDETVSWQLCLGTCCEVAHDCSRYLVNCIEYILDIIFRVLRVCWCRNTCEGCPFSLFHWAAQGRAHILCIFVLCSELVSCIDARWRCYPFVGDLSSGPRPAAPSLWTSN